MPGKDAVEEGQALTPNPPYPRKNQTDISSKRSLFSLSQLKMAFQSSELIY